MGGIYLLCSCRPGHADWAPYVETTLEQIYDSNIFLDPEGYKGRESRSDFRTNIGATFGIRNQTRLRTLELEYTPTYSLFVKNGGESYLRHTAALNFLQHLSQHLFLYAKDNFDYNQEPSTSNYTLQSTAVNQGRRKNLRNAGEGGLEYQFGPEDYLRIYYIDNRLIYPDESTSRSKGKFGVSNDDSVQYGPGAEIIHWINQRNGLDLIYEWQRVDYAVQPSRRIDHIDAGYSYRWSPYTTLRLDYIFDNVRNFGRLSPDFKIHQVQAGFEKIFSQSLSVNVMAGYYHRSMTKSKLEKITNVTPDSSKNDGFMGHLDINYHRSHWHLNMSGESGVRLEFNDYNNRGYTPYRLINLNGSYDLTEKLQIFSSLSYTYESSPDTLRALVEKDHRTETYNASGGLKYLLLKWLTCTIEYNYNDQSETQLSKRDLVGYNDHVVLFRITAIYDWLRHKEKPEAEL